MQNNIWRVPIFYALGFNVLYTGDLKMPLNAEIIKLFFISSFHFTLRPFAMWKF